MAKIDNVGAAYPYRSRQYQRTQNWWSGRNGESGDWKLMSDWCNEACGVGKWEFFYNQFVFENEADLALFLLRWS